MNSLQYVQDIEASLENFDKRVNGLKKGEEVSAFLEVDTFSKRILGLHVRHVESGVIASLQNKLECITNSLFDREDEPSCKDEKKPSAVQRITTIPANRDLLQRSIERIKRFQAVERGAFEVLESGAGRLTKGQKNVLFRKKERIRQQDPKRAYAQASIKLQKNRVEDADAAEVLGITVATFRARRIERAYAKLSQFDSNGISDALNIQPKMLDEWLIQAELEVWLNSTLTELGGALRSRVIEMDSQALEPYLIDLRAFLDLIEKNIHLFTKPLHLLKMQNLMRNMDFIKCKRQVDFQPHKQKCLQLMAMMMDGMKGKRRASLQLLAQTPSAGHELRSLIAAKTFSVVKTQPLIFGLSTLSERQASAVHPKGYIADVKSKAQSAIRVVDQILANPSRFEGLKGELPESAVDFCTYFRNNLANALRIIRKKLDNIAKRQDKRKEMMELGFIFDPPIYFHGTPTIEAAFSIATTGIRPAHGKAYYGAFHSTYPGMLMYGNIIVGLGSRVAFNGNIGSAISKGWFWDSNESLFMPDKRSDFATWLLRHKTKEKWIGLDDLTTINPKVNELKSRFYEIFSKELYAYYLDYSAKMHIQPDEDEFAKFEAELFASFERYHLTVSFQANFFDASKGTWQVQIENRHSDRRGQFVLLDVFQFRDHLRLLKSLPQFSGQLQNNPEPFLNKVQDALKPRQKMSDYFTWSRTLQNMVSAVSDFFTVHVKGFSLEMEESRDMPYTAHIITVDEEGLSSQYFEDTNKWMRAGFTSYTQSQARNTYSQALKGNRGFSNDEIGLRQKRVHDLFLDTHVVTLLEQLMEFDFTTQSGVRVLNDWLR